MNKEEIIKIAKERQAGIDNIDNIDEAIKPFVDYLNNLGFITVASCGSHLLTKDGKKTKNNNSAYVLFYYFDEDIYKLTNLFFHFLNLKKNKNYEITFTRSFHSSLDKYCAVFYIDFNTCKGRGKLLDKIYKSLGININKQIRFGREQQHLSSNNIERKFLIIEEGT